ncbi:HAD family hydrolase [Roseibium sp. Sym1]|uniref:HAD family hydrolase n=1 Tax=Roseibium sp. Sym1 TaxID=3016006 RepID=UPI0022B4170E|nr:HAD family hydrolase [Roseibium sp. Sym1]
MPFTTVLFDLDGTLTDPFDGITRSIQYALEKMGAPAVAAEELRWCIGPPLWDSFRVLLDTQDRGELDRAVAYYRERYTATGLYENTLIKGIPGLLRTLAGAGTRLHVCTSKPHTYAGKIVEHFGLLPYFGKVYGSELDGTRSAKAELIAHILSEESLGGREVVMVGDRKHDLIGANANGVAGIGVLWGYGSREELEEEHPVLIAGTPAEISDFLQPVCTG